MSFVKFRICGFRKWYYGSHFLIIQNNAAIEFYEMIVPVFPCSASIA